jgi:hypothetical protein
MRWIAGLFTTVLLAGCLTAGPGGCSSEEAAAFNGIDHFGGQSLTPEDHPYGICAASFSSDADPDLVIEHYQTVLPAAGWIVQDPESSPILAEDGDEAGTGIGLSATKGTMTFSLGAEVLEGVEPIQFNVLVGESES